MARTLSSARHRRLAELLIAHREAAGPTQTEVARALKRHQPFVSNLESGQWRVDVVELLYLAAVIGFDANAILDAVAEVPREG